MMDAMEWILALIGHAAFVVFVTPFLIMLAVIQLLMKAARVI